MVFSLDARVDIIRVSRPDFIGCYDIYLYDFDQAEGLADYLRRIGIIDVETVPVDEARRMHCAEERAAKEQRWPQRSRLRLTRSTMDGRLETPSGSRRREHLLHPRWDCFARRAVALVVKQVGVV